MSDHGIRNRGFGDHAAAPAKETKRKASTYYQTVPESKYESAQLVMFLVSGFRSWLSLDENLSVSLTGDVAGNPDLLTLVHPNYLDMALLCLSTGWDAGIAGHICVQRR
jgi:hypothetical protein